MLKKSIVLFAGFFIAIGIVGYTDLCAQLKFGYIDVQKVLTTFQESVDAQKTLEGERNSALQELQKMDEEFRKSQETLEQQSLLLSEEKKREKAQELQNMLMRMQQYQKEKDQELLKRQNELLKPVYDKINVAIQSIRKRDGYDLIFDTVNLLDAKEEYDLTDAVLKELGSNVSAGQK